MHYGGGEPNDLYIIPVVHMLHGLTNMVDESWEGEVRSETSYNNPKTDLTPQMRKAARVKTEST